MRRHDSENQPRRSLHKHPPSPTFTSQPKQNQKKKMSSSGSEPAMKSFNGGFIHELLSMNYSLEKLTKIDTLLKCLEEEQRKIDNFKRELPFSMALLNDAIGVLGQELKQCRPVLEEFMPINKKPVQENEDLGFVKERDCEKMNWMSSAQLWSDHKRADDLKEDKAGSDRAHLKPFSRYRSGGTGGAFLPFKSNQREVYKAEKDKKVEKVEKVDLSLASGTKNLGSNCSTGLNLKAKKHPVPETDSHIQRKARRCWSPELHRRFLRALQELGGSHAATPKQIRQLMKVDGLTNDEVKSHLQKYRLHRRSGVSDHDGVSGNGGVSGKTKQVVLMGGIWGPSKQNPDQSGSPQGPLQFAGNGRGDSGEDEDGKSDGYTSWKSHIHMSGEETD